MDLNAALQAAQQYNTGLQKPQSNVTQPQQSQDKLSGALSDAQKFNALLKNGSPAEVGSYTRNAGVTTMQSAGDVPTVGDARKLYTTGADAAIDIQKTQAIEENKRALTTDDEQKSFANATKGWQMLDQLSTSWDQAKATTNGFGAGGLQGLGGAFERLVGGRFGAQSPAYEAWQTITHMSRPILNAAILGEGKAQAGEKSNINGFEANLPEDSDTPAVKESKLNSIRMMQWSSLQSTLNGMDAGGRSAAANTFRQSDQYQKMSKWAQGYTNQLQQQVAPNSFGPVSNGVTPDLDSKLSASIGLKPQAQQPQGSPTPNTNPPGAVKANQTPASVTPPTQQPQAQGFQQDDMMAQGMQGFGQWMQQLFDPRQRVVPGVATNN
jgi:hypothetical protein